MPDVTGWSEEDLIDYSTRGMGSSVLGPEASGRLAGDLDLALAYGEALLEDVAVRHPGVGLSRHCRTWFGACGCV